MRKKMKKAVAIILTMVMTMSASVPAFASNSYEEELQCLAESIIQYEEWIDENGNEMCRYSNLDEFVYEARNNYSGIDELEIARFIAEYTNQNIDSLPEPDLLNFLNYKDLTTSHQQFLIDEEGTITPINDNVMPINTNSDKMDIFINYSETGMVGQEKGYQIWARACWTESPNIYYRDAFALANIHGTYNSDAITSGYTHQKFICNNCGRTTTHYRTVSDENLVFNELELDTSNGSCPYLNFLLRYPACGSCGSTYVDETLNEAYLSYGISINRNTVLNAAYGHSVININSIEVSFGENSGISFSGGTRIDKIYPDGVTIVY